MTAPKRYRNPPPGRTPGPVPVEVVPLSGRRKWPAGVKSVELMPADPPPTEIVLYPQGRWKVLAEVGRKEVGEAMASLAAESGLGAEHLSTFVSRWREHLRDPAVWPQFEAVLQSRAAFHGFEVLQYVVVAVGWRIAMRWQASAVPVFRDFGSSWLTENGPCVWDTLDEPARRRVAELLRERVKVLEAEIRGSRSVLNAFGQFGRSSAAPA